MRVWSTYFVTYLPSYVIYLDDNDKDSLSVDVSFQLNRSAIRIVIRIMDLETIDKMPRVVGR